MNKVEIFNYDILSQIESSYNINEDRLSKSLKEIFNDNQGLDNLNIIFTDNKYIQTLNKEYRNTNTPTDVLSFKISEEQIPDEIYISVEYIYTNFQGEQFKEEILRLIIHGVLHILGYEHNESMLDNPNEDMYILQEKLLLDLKKKCF